MSSQKTVIQGITYVRSRAARVVQVAQQRREKQRLAGNPAPFA